MNDLPASRYTLLIDGSVNPQNGIGYGAFLLLTEEALATATPQACSSINEQIKTQRFNQTSSTHLELETLLWALNTIPRCTQLTIYTDCQNIIKLPQRQQRLESVNYMNKQGQQLPLAHLYIQFYQHYNLLKFALKKFKGHKPHRERTTIDLLFSLVDQKARASCRQLKGGTQGHYPLPRPNFNTSNFPEALHEPNRRSHNAKIEP
ncbi:RNase H family protein [Marinagarivorans algicola]|uniref:RNase H family protein n=1 Tax=Marinagarivorans algicola TaxID=1513270 RepID=UPI0009EB8642